MQPSTGRAEVGTGVVEEEVGVEVPLEETTSAYCNSPFDRSTLQICPVATDISVAPDTSLQQQTLLNGTDSKRVRPSSLAVVPWSEESASDYFCFRSGLIAAAVAECQASLLQSTDGVLRSSHLLTEISYWDSEKERLILLTEKFLFIVKYDFIALKVLESRKISLAEIDTLIIGELTYPAGSIIPQMEGLATGFSYLVKGWLVRPIQERLAGIPCVSTPSFRGAFDRSRHRRLTGVRVMWGDDRHLSFIKRWNPFEREIPFTTFTSHPLVWHKDEGKEGDAMSSGVFSVDQFTVELKRALETRIATLSVSVQHRAVLLENYAGIPSLIHNNNALGFFKVRGKFSF